MAAANDSRPVETQSQPSAIAALNDNFRCHAGAGRVAITAGIVALGGRALVEIMIAVRTFDAFDSDNDPYGEHDFGSIMWDGQKLFWKIDYYDRSFRGASPDPADPDATVRVMTIMLASEY